MAKEIELTTSEDYLTGDVILMLRIPRQKILETTVAEILQEVANTLKQPA